MARTPATTRTEAGPRTQAGPRTSITPFRVPFQLAESGVTQFWDWRGGFAGLNPNNPTATLSKFGLNYAGTSALSSVYTAGEYSIDLEFSNSDFFYSNNGRISSDSLTSITVFAWFKSENTAISSDIITNWRATANSRGFLFRSNNAANNNVLTVFLSNNGNASTQYNSTTGLFTDTNWHFGAFSYDAGTTTMLMNGDGTALSSTIVSGTAPGNIMNTGVPILIGATAASGGGGTAFADGKIGMCGIAVNTAMGNGGLANLYDVTKKLGGYV